MEFEAAVARVQRWPEQGAPYVAGTRYVVLDRFPYLLVYETQPARILVIALAHGARRLGYWRERLTR